MSDRGDEGDLPLDSDAPERPAHRPRRVLGMALVVAGGGALGTAAREALSLMLPPTGGLSWTIFGINVTGAFALAVLMSALAHPGADRPPMIRLLLGTGFLGGFTTYSALALDGALLIGADRLPGALIYGLGTVVVGALATWLGLLTGARLRHAEPRR